MIRYGFIILYTLSILSCEQREINGHYHVKNIEGKERDYFTIDIINDTLASIGRHSFFRQEFGRHNKNKKELDLPGECGSGELKYKNVKNGLLFEGRVLGGRYKGIKCEENCCNRIEDYFSQIELLINLPELPKRLENKEVKKNRESVHNIFIGKPKKEEQEYLGDTTRLQLGRLRFTIRELEYWLREFVSKEEQVIIYAAYESEKRMVLEVLSELKRREDIDILLAYIAREQKSDEIPFKYISVNNVKLYKEN